MGSSEAHPDLIIAGAQDNGTNLWENDSWTHVIGADGMEALIDWYDPQIMYGSIQNGSLQKSDNGGASFSGISNTMTDAENANWVTPYDIDPVDHNTLYAGYENLWKSTDGGVTWNIEASSGSGSNYAYMHVDQHAAEFNPLNNTAYAGNDGGLYKYFNFK